MRPGSRKLRETLYVSPLSRQGRRCCHPNLRNGRSASVLVIGLLKSNLSPHRFDEPSHKDMYGPLRFEI